MSKSAQKWSFKITNSQNFISFLKKLKLVDKSVPLEIEGERLFAKVKTNLNLTACLFTQETDVHVIHILSM